jgi:DNA-binding MarR family transcriptional regulator
MSEEGRERLDVAARLAFVVGMVTRRLRSHGTVLTPAALSALASIARAGAIRPGDLARAEGTGAPGVTRLLTELEQRGYVLRQADPDDRRSVLVRSTPAGDAAVLDARRARAAGVAELLEACDEADLAAIEGAVGALERALLTTVPDQRRGQHPAAETSVAGTV